MPLVDEVALSCRSPLGLACSFLRSLDNYKESSCWVEWTFYFGDLRTFSTVADNIDLNPKIGADWTLKGQQKKVVTPGQNCKHYLAGALHSESGKVLYVSGTKKDSELFIAMLEKLKRRYRRAKSITLILDNYIIHKSKKTKAWLKQNPKFNLLFQPVYCPWVNVIERLWNALHETITRNHRCKHMWQLLHKVKHFMDNVSPYPGGCHGTAKM